MPECHSSAIPTDPVPPEKFAHLTITADGQPRAHVAVSALTTLWVNTGSLCNLACEGCYIESSPSNDRLDWFRPDDLSAYFDEIRTRALPIRTVGFTGGEPFANPHIMALLDMSLAEGFSVLVLTNGLTPMRHHRPVLAALAARYPGALGVRVSLDHATAAAHEAVRGPNTFAPAVESARWLACQGIGLSIAGRARWGEDETTARTAYAALFKAESLPLDAWSTDQLVLFPEMTDPDHEAGDVPEITSACWNILHRSPDDMMCASARMVVRRKDRDTPSVLACTLIAYDDRFDLGPSLTDALHPVALAHPHCARFCVLGGARCSG